MAKEVWCGNDTLELSTILSCDNELTKKEIDLTWEGCCEGTGARHKARVGTVVKTALLRSFRESAIHERSTIWEKGIPTAHLKRRISLNGIPYQMWCSWWNELPSPFRINIFVDNSTAWKQRIFCTKFRGFHYVIRNWQNKLQLTWSILITYRNVSDTRNILPIDN